MRLAEMLTIPPSRPLQMPHDFNQSDRGPRLHKVLADAGVGSRRACETLIASGAVSVNGKVVTSSPAWVDPIRDRITVNRKRIRPPEKPVYIMLFKPRGIVCTNEDPEGRRRAIDLIHHPARPRLYPVGRLDVESSGLLLLTNDGDLANRLMHPRYGVHKSYEVTVEGTLDAPAVARLERGVFLTNARDRGRTDRRRRGTAPARDHGGGRTRRSQLTLLRSSRQRTRLLMQLREGRNRQIRRMMARVGHKVRKLRRIQLGPLKLKGLRPGQWRELLPQELAALKRAAYRDEKGKRRG